jgi:LCP family protein required for cell wall assembly
VVTIDPASKKVGMLSIPRDFWISVPGSGMHKLDEAYGLGGVALSRLTIVQDFGIPISYYAWVGLDGFIKVINTVGGVDVDVLHPITDDNYPDDVGNNTGDIFAYKRLYVPPGPQHHSGPEALEYVRSRHADLVGDFGRSARQQQVLSALKTKLNNPDIIGKMTEIAHDLDGYVKTDMQLTDVFKLMNFARGLNPNSIDRVILGPPYSQSGNTPGRESVVFPDCSKIVPVIAQMFALGNKAACNIQANSNTNAVASASQPASTISSNITDSRLQAGSQLASTSAMSLVGGSDNLHGLHSLLDLMFMVVFESPQALQA